MDQNQQNLIELTNCKKLDDAIFVGIFELEKTKINKLA